MVHGFLFYRIDSTCHHLSPADSSELALFVLAYAAQPRCARFDRTHAPAERAAKCWCHLRAPLRISLPGISRNHTAVDSTRSDTTLLSWQDGSAWFHGPTPVLLLLGEERPPACIHR